MKNFWKKHSIYSLKATDSNGKLVCEGETRNAIDFGSVIYQLNILGYDVTYTPYEEKVNLFEAIFKSGRFIRNYLFSIMFIISMIICYFKDNAEHTVLKSGIAIWLIILIGWCIYFILDNHYKMDKTTIRASDVLLHFDDALKYGKIDKLVHEIVESEIKDFYKNTLEERKTFQKEIAVILGGIGTIIGSAAFMKIIGI